MTESSITYYGNTKKKFKWEEVNVITLLITETIEIGNISIRIEHLK